MSKISKWLGITAGILVLAVAVVIAVAGLLYTMKAPVRTAGGMRQHTSLYIPMSDGVRIAVDVWLPKDLAAGGRVPVLIEGTPYWRGGTLTFIGKAAAELGLFDPAPSDIARVTAHGYAVLSVDTRGTGASFGHQDIMFSDREIADFGELVDWAAKQPWSSGAVGAYGFSYRGMLAVNLASLSRPALKAIAPSFDVPDLYLAGYPGGIFSEKFLHAWGSQTGLLNRGALPCGWLCYLMVKGPERVDADTNGTLVRRAIAQHAGDYDIYACAKKAPFRDSKICTSGKSLDQVSEFAREDAIGRSGVPMYVVAGWFDESSPAAVLRRFDEFPNPQYLTMAALSHGGFMNTDPYAAKNAPPDPTTRAQLDGMLGFFDQALKEHKAPLAGKTLRYKVLNGGWKTSHTWPPKGCADEPWYLAGRHTLRSTMPASRSDVYKVDFTATTGTLARNMSPVDLSRTAYPDRAERDKKLLVYDSAPLAGSITLAGDPIARLTLASSTTDGEVIVYLEDVAPNGKVIYLTEGELRLADRKPVAGARVGDPLHSYLAADAEPMTPGKAEAIAIALSPIAVRIAKGHRIRIAIAGADAGNLERIPARGSETFTLALGASQVDLPVMAE